MNSGNPTATPQKAQSLDGVDTEVRSPIAGPVLDFGELFVRTCRALACGSLRLGPRERQLGLSLAVESFGQGRAWAPFDIDWLWVRLRPKWRRGEVKGMVEDWRRAGWVAVDVAAGECRLAPDRLPGWAECFLSEPNGALPLSGGVQIGNMVAEISQERGASRTGHLSRTGPHCENSAPPSVPSPGLGEPRCENFAAGASLTAKISQQYVTFKRSDVLTNQRLNVNVASRTDCENTAGVEERMEAVRKFVGDRDWEQFWKCGAGWRGLIFEEDAQWALMARALRYVQSGLKTGETVIKKTAGAMLWNQFQTERRLKQQREGK